MSSPFSSHIALNITLCTNTENTGKWNKIFAWKQNLCWFVWYLKSQTGKWKCAPFLHCAYSFKDMVSYELVSHRRPFLLLISNLSEGILHSILSLQQIMEAKTFVSHSHDRSHCLFRVLLTFYWKESCMGEPTLQVSRLSTMKTQWFSSSYSAGWDWMKGNFPKPRMHH